MNIAMSCIAVILQTPGCLPPNVIGKPGGGKTSRIRQLAERLELPHETVIGSIRDPSDYAGLPIPTDTGVMMAAPAWAKRMVEHGRGLVIHDEISCAPPAVQAGILRVILENEVGDTVLPTGVKQIAIMNPPENAAGGWDLSDPLANRLIHITLEAPSAEEFGAYITGGQTGVENLPIIKDDEEWRAAFVKGSAIVAAFLRARSTMISEDPEVIRGRFPMAYATPRTWEATARLLASCEVSGVDGAVTMTLIAGAIGPDASTQFLAYMRAIDLPDPEKVLSGEIKFVPDKARPDRTYAVLVSVSAAAVRKDFKTALIIKRWNAAWQVLNGCMTEGKDIVATSARTLASNRPAGQILRPEIRSIINALSGVIREALCED